MSQSQEEPKRLPPRVDVLRELYLFSGNFCAFPGCNLPILDHEGTLIGDIAHIQGVMPDSARFNDQMTNEDRRHASNLVLLCKPHHASVDNPKLADIYTLPVVSGYKKEHEARFRRGVRALEVELGDATAETVPVLPSNLRALGLEPGDEDHDTSLLDVIALIASLRKVPPAARRLLGLAVDHGKIPSRIPLSAIEITKSRLRQLLTGVNEYDFYGLLSTLEEDDLLGPVDETEELLRVSPDGGIGLQWDVLQALKELVKDGAVLQMAIAKLDFSAFEEVSDGRPR